MYRNNYLARCCWRNKRLRLLLLLLLFLGGGVICRSIENCPCTLRCSDELGFIVVIVVVVVTMVVRQRGDRFLRALVATQRASAAADTSR